MTTIKTWQERTQFNGPCYPREAQEEIDELRADRDSWASQAEDRVKDCADLIAECEQLRAKLACGHRPKCEDCGEVKP